MVSPVQQKSADSVDKINKIEGMIDQKVKEDTQNTVLEIMALLILYIIASMSGDKDGQKKILEQLGEVSASLGKEAKEGRELKELLESLRKEDPSGLSQEMLDAFQKIAQWL